MRMLLTTALLPALLTAPAMARHAEPVPPPAATPAGAREPSLDVLPERRAMHAALESALLETASGSSLRDNHALLSSEPHVAGTPGGRRKAERLAEMFRSFGLEVETPTYQVLLPHPVSASVRIVSPDVVDLPLRERPLPEDPDTSHPELWMGWNAWSASGEAEGRVVYANYGTKEDFERLAALGVDCRGAIVVARYGRNFRGYKARYAQEAGAAGLIIYSDPQDSGYVRGLMWPEGGWGNETSIQRGSIVTLPYNGDVQTPFVAATPDAPRLDPATLDLPKIPVQPMGFAAAQEILVRMRGRPTPREWQGGLPLTYRLEGGEALRVRMRVEQRSELREIRNVLGIVRGERQPDQMVIVGGHHDAWGFGADDPNSGLMVVVEAARSFGEALRRGLRPARTVVFAGWDAEEYGIIGSVEWVEDRAADLTRGAVAYVNLDASVSGLLFGAAGSPSLHRAIEGAAAGVAQPMSDGGQTLRDAWLARLAGRGAAQPETPGGMDRAARSLSAADFGLMGGGSDHVGFVNHVGVPSTGLSMGGGDGVAYHSAYDTVRWWRHVAGDHYEGALALTRAVNLLTARLANADLLPLDIARPLAETRRHLEGLQRRGATLGIDARTPGLTASAERLEAAANAAHARILEAFDAGRLTGERLDAVNAAMLWLDRAWLHEPGLPGRSWRRNLFVAPDETSGYASWPLPGLRWAVEQKDPAALAEWAGVYQSALARIEQALQVMEFVVSREADAAPSAAPGPAPASGPPTGR